jgi:nitrogen fixation-related uncharacterized protein
VNGALAVVCGVLGGIAIAALIIWAIARIGYDDLDE